MIETLAEDWDRALCVVAHPDDMEYGAAGAVARWTGQGKRVTYVLATRGEAGIDGLAPDECAAVREVEQRTSAAIVGVDMVEFLDHPDGTIEYGLRLRRDIADAIRRHRPEVVVGINHRDTWGGRSLNMADHRHIGLAILDAVRDAANRWVFIDLGEPWAGVRRVCFAASPEPTHAVDISDHLDAAIASLRAHATYLDHVGGDAAEFLTGNATSVGEQAGVKYAVSFEVFDF